MDLDQYLAAKTPATLPEITRRVMFALDRHPLCRGIEFEVVSLPRSRKSNWTVTLQAITPTPCGRRPISWPISRKPTNWPRRPDSGLFRDDFPSFLIGLRL